MKLNNKKIFQSLYIFLPLVGIYLIGIFLPIDIKNLLPLVPSKAFYDYEFWRLITFPLGLTSITSFILISYVIFVIIPQLKTVLKGKDIALLSILIVFLQGIVFSLLFRDNNYIFSGTDGLSFFLIFLFVGFRFYPNFGKHQYFPSKISLVTLLMVLLWSSMVVFSSGNLYNKEVFSQISSAVFGINMGIFAYFLIKAEMLKRKRKLLQSKLDKAKAIENELPKLYEYAISQYAQASMKQNSSNSDETFGNTSYYEFHADEDTLNQILDKISINGQDSLTYNERRFLEDYSNYLK